MKVNNQIHSVVLGHVEKLRSRKFVVIRFLSEGGGDPSTPLRHPTSLDTTQIFALPRPFCDDNHLCEAPVGTRTPYQNQEAGSGTPVGLPLPGPAFHHLHPLHPPHPLLLSSAVWPSPETMKLLLIFLSTKLLDYIYYKLGTFCGLI